MRAAKRAALDVLAKSADTYNCWACLDEAVRGDEEDGFSHDLIESEREMLANAIVDELRALKKLGEAYGIGITACVGVGPWKD
jgi:hypothetical protein